MTAATKMSQQKKGPAVVSVFPNRREEGREIDDYLKERIATSEPTLAAEEEEAIKKKKVEENGTVDLSEDARKRLEPFNQDQVLDIRQEATVKHLAVLDAVRAITNSDTNQRKLFIRGLGWDTTTTNELRTIFSIYGQLEEVVVSLDKASSKPKGYCFITFKHIGGAINALQEPITNINGRMTVTQIAAAGNHPSAAAADVSTRKIFIGNVPNDMPADRLLVHFLQYGEIEEGPLGYDKQTGKLRGYALFVYKTADEGFSPIPMKWKGVCQNCIDENDVKCNKKLIGAHYFNEGYISYYHHPDNSSFSSPSDHDGHGTHTRSTAAGITVSNTSIFRFADGTAKGGSLRARVVAYEVCWSSNDGEGACLDANILAAFDAAIGNGVDIISVSIGGDPTDDIMEGIAIGLFHAVSSGITVICSAGNSSPLGGGTSLSRIFKHSHQESLKARKAINELFVHYNIQFSDLSKTIYSTLAEGSDGLHPEDLVSKINSLSFDLNGIHWRYSLMANQVLLLIVTVSKSVNLSPKVWFETAEHFLKSLRSQIPPTRMLAISALNVLLQESPDRLSQEKKLTVGNLKSQLEDALIQVFYETEFFEETLNSLSHYHIIPDSEDASSRGNRGTISNAIDKSITGFYFSFAASWTLTPSREDKIISLFSANSPTCHTSFSKSMDVRESHLPIELNSFNLPSHDPVMSESLISTVEVKG